MKKPTGIVVFESISLEEFRLLSKEERQALIEYGVALIIEPSEENRQAFEGSCRKWFEGSNWKQGEIRITNL